MENYENGYQAPEMETNPYGQDFSNYRTEFVDKKEYLKKHAPASFYKTIKVAAIISYVLVGINVLLVIFNPFSIFDIAIMLGLTLGVHLKKSKGCAIALLIYGIFCVVVGLLANGSPTGWAWIVIPIAYLMEFSKAEKEYKSIYGA